MTVNVGAIIGTVELQDKFTAVLSQLASNVRNQVDQITATAVAGTKKGYDYSSMLERMALRVGALTVAYRTLSTVSQSVTESIDVKKQLGQIEILTNAGAKGANELRQSFGRMASEVGKGPQELSKAYYLIASASQSGAHNMDLLETATRASAVGMGDTADVAKALVGAVNAFSKSGLTAAKAGDMLFEAVRQGGAEANTIAPAFGRVAALAAQMGVSFQDALTYIASFTRLGVNAAEATTALRGTLSILERGAPSTRKALAEVGLSLEGVRQEIREKGLTAAMFHLMDATKGSDSAFANIFKNVRALSGNLAVYSAQAKDTVEIQKAMGESAGALGRGYDIASRSGILAADRLAAQWENFKLLMGNQVAPAVLEVGKSLTASFENGAATHLGEAIARVVRDIQPLVMLAAKLADNIWLIEAAVAGWITKWAIGTGLNMLNAVIRMTPAAKEAAAAIEEEGDAAAAASTKTTGLFGAIGGLTTVLTAAVVAYVALKGYLVKMVDEMQADIERSVRESNEFGNHMQALLRAKRGDAISADETERAKNELTPSILKANELAEAYQKAKAARAEFLANPPKPDAAEGVNSLRAGGDSGFDGHTIGVPTKEEIADLKARWQEAHKIAEANRRVAAEGAAQAKVIAGIGAGITPPKEPDAPPPALTAAAKKQAEWKNRIDETVTSLKAQTEAAQAAYDEMLLRKAGTATQAESAAVHQLTLEEKAQAEAVKITNGLNSLGYQIDDKVRTTIYQQVLARMKLTDATQQGNKEMSAQERAQAILVTLAEKHAAAERAVLAALKDMALTVQHDLLDAFTKLDESSAVLAAWAKGGADAARYQDELNKLLAQGVRTAADLTAQYGSMEEAHRAGVSSAEEIAALTGEIGKAQERVNYLLQEAQSLSKELWQYYHEAAMASIDAVGTAINSVITQALTKGKVDWTGIFRSLRDEIVKIFADMITQLIANWLKKELLETAITAAEAAKRAALNRASQAAGGGSPGASAFTTGGGNYAGTAATAGGGHAAGASAGTVAGGLVLAFAAFVIYKGFIEDHMRSFNAATIDMAGNVRDQAGHGHKYLQGLLDAIKDVFKGTSDFLQEMNVQMTSYGQVIIENSKEGFAVNGQLYKTLAEAEDAAIALRIRFGEFADTTSAMVQAAIKGTSAIVGQLNTAALKSNIEFAHRIETQNLPEIASQMSDLVDGFIADFKRAFDLFGDLKTGNMEQLGIATTSIITHFTTGLTDLYNTLTGHKDDPKQAAERQRVAYNMQRIVMIAQITLLYEEIKARVAEVQAMIARRAAMVNGGIIGGGGNGNNNGGGTGPNANSNSTTPYKDLGKPNVQPDTRNPTNDPQLAALLIVLDNLARALQGLPPEIAPGGVKPGAGGGHPGGGGGRQQQQQDQVKNLQGMIADVNKLWAQRGMTDFQKRLDDINRKWDEATKGLKNVDDAEKKAAAARDKAIKAANGNKDAIDKANKAYNNQIKKLEETRDAIDDANTARQHEIDLATQEFQKDVTARFNEAIGNTNAFTELHKKFDDLRTDIGTAGYSADVAAGMMAKLGDAEKAAVEALGQQMTSDLLGGLIGMLDDGALKTKLIADQAKLNWLIQLANLKAQYALLISQGLLVGQLRTDVEEAIHYIETHPPVVTSNNGPFFQLPDGTIIDANGNVIREGNAGAGNDIFKQAQDLFKKYQDQGLNKWQLALRDFNEDWNKIFASLGRGSDVMDVYNASMERLRQQFLGGLKELYDSMTTGSASGAPITSQYTAAAANYQQLRAAVMGGDLSQADALKAAAETYRDLANQMFGSSTGGAISVRDQIVRDLASILGVTNTASNTIGGPSWFATSTQQTISAIDALKTTVASTSAASGQHLANIDLKMSALIDGVADLAGVDPITLGFSGAA